MKENDLENIRNQYKEFEEKKKELENNKEKLLSLKNDENVKKYIKLKEIINENEDNLDEEEYIYKIFNDVCLDYNEKDSNHIMIYQGTYIKNDKEHHLTYDLDENFDYLFFLDLETTKPYSVDKNNIEQFEDENLTIYFKVDEYEPLEYYNKYMEIRKWYYSKLITKSQEEVIKEFKNNYQNKIEILKEYRKLWNNNIKPINEANVLLKMDGGPIKLDFDPKEFDEQYAQNGFVENHCITEEEKRKLHLYRRNNK